MLESVLVGAASNVLYELFRKKAEDSEKEKKNYSEKLETATGDDIFKYILLPESVRHSGFLLKLEVAKKI